jgi:hypothetical protein
VTICQRVLGDVAFWPDCHLSVVLSGAIHGCYYCGMGQLLQWTLLSEPEPSGERVHHFAHGEE